ncbi:membrane protease YdiL (CAAX protease family) [Allocatelliglobosispora scoriae]|uniref:Membrane protease YdiL (CAAX protease family) n=1 Tax=Allocatelliglobosispora scoriae TaxID=643052 RepID=A0A841BW96_9ACTN|nr:CPBP family glutamic-type intramembrane protease [Allocatelliglobosispora scoriae]MBB5871748.1 membrane protease YdiL (CAAX protease family) [Allocatelliglobosispora scoriae]
MTAPAFSGPATVLVAVMVAYLGTFGPILGRRRFRELTRTRRHDPAALTRYYRRFLISWWLVALSVPVIGILSPSLRVEDLGIAWPSGRFALWIGLSAFALVAYLAITGQRVARMIRAGEVFPVRQAIAPALPSTPHERLLAVAVSVTAGIVEEVYFRGLLIAAGVGILGLPVLVSAALSLLLFAAGHLYQGGRGIIGSGTIGLLLTVLYLTTGSLLLPIIVHALVDINALVLIPASTPEQVAAAELRAEQAGAEALPTVDQSHDHEYDRDEQPTPPHGIDPAGQRSGGGLRPAAPGGD